MSAVLQFYIFTFLICFTGSIFYGIPEKSWSDATDSCSLPPKDDIDSEEVYNISKSCDIQKAWTGTRVKFSRWSAFVGCSDGFISESSENGGNKLSIKECLMKCSDSPQNQYFLIQDTECNCSTNPVSLGGRSDCRNTCEERNESLCSSGKSSMVFKLINVSEDIKADKTFREDECASVYYDKPFFNEYRVNDCREEFMFTCSNTSYQPSPRSWNTYQEKCHEDGESVLFEKNYVGKWRNNYRYWTPMFRTHRYITKGTPSTDEYCLAISTKGDYTLEDCSKRYPFLCSGPRQKQEENTTESASPRTVILPFTAVIASGIFVVLLLLITILMASKFCTIIKSCKEKLKNLNQARELNESTYIGLEDRNHEETGYREIVTSDSNPNIANADVPCTQPETLHTSQVDTEGYLVPEPHYEIIPIVSNCTSSA